MISLETTFVSGEGGFSAAPLTYTQISRQGQFAVYERSRNGKVKDFETIIIRVDPKGKVIFKQVLEDDRERYPGASVFGTYGWSFSNRTGAMKKFHELCNPATSVKVLPEVTEVPEVEDDDDSSEPPKRGRGRPKRELPNLNLPNGEFTTKALAEFNNVEYTIAFQFIRANPLQIRFVRQARFAAKGKPSSVYIKA
jgi:hypothetical protein